MSRSSNGIVAALGLITLLCQFSSVHPYYIDRGDDSRPSLTSPETILISLGLLTTVIFVIALCAGGFRNCWPARYFHGRRREEVPAGFSNPIANSSGSISEIDVRALELDPIVFEPLPTLTDLTPQHGEPPPLNVLAGRMGTIVPFTADESSIYAHDWFDEPFNNFPRGNLEYIKQLGKGWFGQIIEAEARDIVPYARKIRVLVKALREDASGLDQMKFLDESRLYRDADHGNLLKLLGHSIEMTPFLLIMEYCPQGDLKSYLISNVTRADLLNSRGDIIRMALDIAKGLEWMGSAGFTHGDLAARNCQVGSEGRIVIGDYGIATHTFKDDYYWSSNIAIPLRWAAPETIHCTINTIQTLRVTNMSNVWTFGVVLWEIAEFGKLPYFELNDDEVISRVLSDRSYILGQPTMPCLIMRESLYKIMTSCWNSTPEKRPGMATIVETLSAFLAESQFLPKKKDDFEIKWNQVGNGGMVQNHNNSRQVAGSGEANKKKSVSFLEKAGSPASPGIQQNEVQTRAETFQTEPTCVASSSFSKTQMFENSNGQDPFSSFDLWKPSDPDEELWRKRLERGDIAQKVREKSQSVQDLMVLTHMEPGELSDPESLVILSGSKSGSPPSSGTPLRKASSETALNSITNSPVKSPSHCMSTIPTTATAAAAGALISSEKPESSSLLVPEIQVIPATPTNTTGIDIKVISATPNPGIAINVIQATPNPGIAINVIQPTPTPIERSNSTNSDDMNTTYAVNKNMETSPRRKIKFVFNDEESPEATPVAIIKNVATHRRGRHTSTPIRSASPRLDEASSPNNSGTGDYDVFNSTSERLGESPPISPISQKFGNGGGAEPSVTRPSPSVFYGASEELGLNHYQSITSEIGDPSLFCIYDRPAEDSVKKPPIAPKPLKANFFVGPSSADSSHFGRSVWVVSDSEQETRLEPDAPSSALSDSVFLRGSEELASLPRAVPAVRRKLIFVGEPEGTHSAGGGDAELFSKPYKTSQATFSTNSQAPAAVPPNPDLEEDEFWAKQMQSLKQATGNTLALFQLGLNPDEGTEKRGRVPSAKDTFEQDIKAATEEMGSLVFTDLDESDSAKAKALIVKETRHPLGPEIPVPSGRSQNAFGGEVKTETEDEESRALTWALNSSIEVKKQSDSLKGNLNSLTADEEEPEDESEICTDFVPSKWNSSLNPSKPTIKSPEVLKEAKTKSLGPQKRTGIRKSVSFERKRTQLVYEYPPLAANSDSEEEDRRVTVSSAGPLALSLDWELQPEELEEAEIHHEEWEDDVLALPKTETERPMDLYRISGFDDNFQVRGSSQPFGFQSSQPSTTSPTSSVSRLGELRHTKDRLKLDLCNRGEASLLDEEGKKLDSGVGSSTNVSPFSQL